MPKVAKGKRQRAYRPKTRSGCLTCKTRRIKCDETLPACLKCTSTGRTCDGYPVEQVIRSPPSDIVSIISGPSFDIHASPQSKQAFAFFAQQTSPELAGFFAANFWERLVLQAAYHESAILHAIVAIGSLHEQLHQSAMDGPANSFALEHYNLAIRDLLVPLAQNKKRGVDVCLIACLLFTCFENMQGRHALAGGHIRSGVSVLNETIYDLRKGTIQHKTLGSERYADSYAPIDELSRMFTGLDRQVIWTSDDSEKFRFYESSLANVADADPQTFSSIAEAKFFFEYACGKFMQDNPMVPSSTEPVSFEEVEARFEYYIGLLSKFSRTVQAYVDSKGPFLSTKEDIARSVLQLHVLTTYITLRLEQIPPSRRPGWEHCMPQVKEMIMLGEKIISFMSSGSDRSTSFCLDMGYVIPLFSLASQCQDYALRRRGIALLRSTSRQEGLWNSGIAANAAERIMEIQEEDVKNMGFIDGPKWSSIRPLFELDKSGGRLRYRRPGHAVEIVEDIFAW